MCASLLVLVCTLPVFVFVFVFVLSWGKTSHTRGWYPAPKLYFVLLLSQNGRLLVDVINHNDILLTAVIFLSKINPADIKYLNVEFMC